MPTSSEIRGILFGDSQHLIKLTELMDYLRTILEDTEYKVGHAQRDLELQTRAILRIRQLLKGAIGNKKGNPYHTFLRQCLNKTRDTGSRLEYLMSELRQADRFLRKTNNDTFSPIGSLVHVGGVVRAGGSGASRGVGEVRGTGGVIRGGGYRGGACGSGPSRGDYGGGARGRGTSRGGARGSRRSRSRSRSVSRSKSKESSLDSSVRTHSPSPSPTPSVKRSRSRDRSRSGSYREESGERRVNEKESGPRDVFNSDSDS